MNKILKHVNTSTRECITEAGPMILWRIIGSKISPANDAYIWRSIATPIDSISLKELVGSKITLQVKHLNNYYKKQ